MNQRCHRLTRIQNAVFCRSVSLYRMIQIGETVYFHYSLLFEILFYHFSLDPGTDTMLQLINVAMDKFARMEHVNFSKHHLSHVLYEILHIYFFCI